MANWWIVERLRTEYQLPLGRCRWVNDGESFDASDRSFLAGLPPVFDSPSTRGLLDSRTGVLWASDCFASLLTHPVTDGAELDQAFELVRQRPNMEPRPMFNQADLEGMLAAMAAAG